MAIPWLFWIPLALAVSGTFFLAFAPRQLVRERLDTGLGMGCADMVIVLSVFMGLLPLLITFFAMISKAEISPYPWRAFIQVQQEASLIVSIQWTLAHCAYVCWALWVPARVYTIWASPDPHRSKQVFPFVFNIIVGVGFLLISNGPLWRLLLFISSKD